MSDESKLPEAWSDEDGERWWAQGHIDPAAMVLAVVVEQAVNCGPAEAYELLTGHGPDEPYRNGAGIVNEDRFYVPWPERRAHADSLLACVGHLWLKPHPDNDERMDRAEEGDEGAEAWTEFQP